MRKYYLCLALVISITFFGGLAQASDVSNARRIGNLIITNNSTATSAVSTNFSLSTPVLIASGDVLSDLSDVTIQYNSQDVAFMPGANSTSPWVVFVENIGQSQTLNYSLYTGGVTGTTKLAYFPSNNMTISDNGTMEIGNNGSISWSGYIDTSTSGIILNKANAFELSTDGSGNLSVKLGNAISDQTSYNESYSMYNGFHTKVAQRLNSFVGRISSVGFYLSYATNPPTGTAYAKVWRVSDGAELGTLGLIDTSTLTLSAVLYTFNTTQVIISSSTDIYIGIEFDAGDATHILKISDSNANPYSGANLYYKDGAGAWTSVAGSDLAWYNLSTVILSKSGLSAAEYEISVTANTTHWKLYLGGDLKDSLASSLAMPNRKSNWGVGSSATPYIYSFEVEKPGSQTCYIEWQYILLGGTKFEDQSGNGNHATPNFRKTSSDPDVSASLTSYQPTSKAQLTTWTLGGAGAILTSTANFSAKMYSEGDYTRMPGADVVNALLAASGTPRALWWFPFLYGFIAILAFMIYAVTTGRTSRITGEASGMGSLLVMAVVIEVGLILVGTLGAVPMWPAYLFPVPALAIILSQKHYGWGANLQENFMPFLMTCWFISVLICIILEGSDLGRSMGGGWNMAGIIGNLSQLQGLSIASLVAIGSFVLDFISAIFRVLLWDYSFYTGDYMIFRWIMMAVFSPAIVWGLAKVFTPIFANFLRIF